MTTHVEPTGVPASQVVASARGTTPKNASLTRNARTTSAMRMRARQAVLLIVWSLTKSAGKALYYCTMGLKGSDAENREGKDFVKSAPWERTRVAGVIHKGVTVGVLCYTGR